MKRLKFIFCEGKDDVAVLTGLVRFLKLENLVIEDVGGRANFQEFLRVAALRPQFTRDEVAAVGIVRDADADGMAAFQSVSDALRVAGFDPPATSGSFSTAGIKVGVMVIGPVNGNGMLEDLCLQSVSDLPEFNCVGRYFQCIADRSERRSFTSKAKVRVWMSSQVDYDLRGGLAAELGYWPWESPAFDPLKAFLKEL